MKIYYQADPAKELSPDFVSKAVMDFNTRHIARLKKLENYYMGKQKILFKQATDYGKPCNSLVTNYCNSIVKSYNGYLTGKPIKYSNDEFTDVIDILNYNDTTTEDTELLKNALIYGISYEICYLDEEGKQRFKVLSPKECIPVYANNLNGDLLYVIRFYKELLLEKELDDYWIEVYGANTVRKYRSSPGWISAELVEEKPNYYNQCQISVFELNEEQESIFNQIITLQDAYNEVMSAGVDDIQSWADAYLVLKGVVANEEDLASMKTNRVLMIDEEADANYLTKDTGNEELQYIVKTIDEQIHNISHAPNLLDEKFLAQSGIALKMKLVGFETEAAAIENNMRKVLQRRIELICSILSLTDDEQKWRDVEITFTRNLPLDLSSDASTVNQLRGLVSDETLLTLLPFVKDVEEELEKVKKQKDEEAKLYGDDFQETTE